MQASSKTISSIAGASIVLTLLGFLSKGIGFIREIIYANYFGLSPEFDLFLSSIALPNVINTATIYLTQHYFIPSYNKINSESEEEGIKFFNKTFWFFVLCGLIISLSLFFTSDIILGAYMKSISIDMREKGLRIFLLFLITIPINAGMSVIMAYQQAKFKFVYPAFALIFLNVLVIIMILFFSGIFQIFILPISFICAYFISFIYLYVLVKDNLKLNSISLIKEKFRISNLNILLSLIFIEGLSLSYVLIDRFFIGQVSAGGIAAVNYAFVIYSLPISLFSIPLVTTLFSKFSNSPATLKSDFKSGYGMIFFIMIPFMFLFYFWGDLFLYLFYERGKFTSTDTSITYAVLRNFSFGLIFISTYHLMVKILYSLNKYIIVLVISVLAFFIKAILSLYLVKIFAQNGLALATTFVYVFLFISGITMIALKMDIIDLNNFIFKLIYFLICGLSAYLVTKTFLSFLSINNILLMIITLISFISIYILNSFITQIHEFDLISDTTKNLLKIKKPTHF